MNAMTEQPRAQLQY